VLNFITDPCFNRLPCINRPEHRYYYFASAAVAVDFSHMTVASYTKHTVTYRYM